MKELSNTILLSVIFDEVGNVFCALFNIQMFEVKPSKLRASVYNRAREVSVVSESCEDMADYWFLYVIECVE